MVDWTDRAEAIAWWAVAICITPVCLIGFFVGGWFVLGFLAVWWMNMEVHNPFATSKGLPPDREPRFSGNCMVRQHTGDGVDVGPCWHSTYDGVCHVHGNVAAWINGKTPWPNDYDLSPPR
jgi:hypothetical protein